MRLRPDYTTKDSKQYIKVYGIGIKLLALYRICMATRIILRALRILRPPGESLWLRTRGISFGHHSPSGEKTFEFYLARLPL